MFFRGELALVQFLFVVSGLSVELIEEKLKRTDVDLPTCIENFDVHKDKIIRTTDSRSMGAKYLNEMDLDSRVECLRLCCETENCDVFVFEEKNAGSCYLFQCGPPEDFKCKFTHHVNYTSAVLAINRHLPDLESQIKLTKHEQDLSKLRKPEINTGNREMVPAEATTTQTTTSSSTVKIKIDPIGSAKTDSPLFPSNRKCSNYQFECRSTGECIAIYNACDGIPQCADGSDEAPELRCPESPPSATTTIKTLLPLKSPQQGPHNEQNIAPLNLEGVSNGDGGRAAANEMYQRPMPMVQNLIPKLPAPEQQYMRPQIQVPYQPPYLSDPQNNWAQQVPQRLSQYPGKNSHIFNHKGSGLQVPDTQDQSQMQVMGDGHDYQKLPNYYQPDAYGPPMQQFPDNWPNQPAMRVPNLPQYGPELNQIDSWNPNGKQLGDPQKMVYNKPATKTLPVSWKVEKEIPKHEQDKMAHELKHSKDHFISSASSSSKVEPSKNLAMQYKLTADTLEAIEDGIAETPSGAVLSLTLGLLITSLMAILVGCRMRVVRRRLRRGGKTYAHDADYLVNGMYL